MPATEPINEKIEATNGHAMLGHDNSHNDEPMSVFPNQPQQPQHQQPPPQQQINETPSTHMQQQQQQHHQPQVQQQPVVPEPSFNFLQESQIDLESPHMDPAVVMVHPAKRPQQVQHHPPGIQAGGYVDQSRHMLQHMHIQQQQQQQIMLAHQQQAVVATVADNKFGSSRNSAFDAPVKTGAPGMTMTNGHHPPGHQQTSPSDRPAPSTDPRAPRVPDGTPQHADPSPNKAPVFNSAAAAAPSQPAGYAAAAGGAANGKQPDTEIGTWRPDGAVNGEEEEEESRHNGDKGRRGRGGGGRGFGRGGGGNGGKGYSRGRGGGGDRGYRGGRGGGGERRQYDDRRDDRPRGR